MIGLKHYAIVMKEFLKLLYYFKALEQLGLFRILSIVYQLISWLFCR